MRKFFSFVLVAAVVAISMAFWAIFIALIAWSVVFLTGALHGSGLTVVPALSFWESMAISLTLLSLVALLLRAVRRNNRREGR